TASPTSDTPWRSTASARTAGRAAATRRPGDAPVPGTRPTDRPPDTPAGWRTRTVGPEPDREIVVVIGRSLDTRWTAAGHRGCAPGRSHRERAAHGHRDLGA